MSPYVWSASSTSICFCPFFTRSLINNTFAPACGLHFLLSFFKIRHDQIHHPAVTPHSVRLSVYLEICIIDPVRCLGYPALIRIPKSTVRLQVRSRLLCEERPHLPPALMIRPVQCIHAVHPS